MKTKSIWQAKCRSTVLAVAVLSLCAAALSAAPQKILKTYVTPKSCSCGDKHGNVMVAYQSGAKAKLTKTGLCINPKVSPDRSMCGWLTGKHEDTRDGYLFLPDTLVLNKSGKVVRTMQSRGDYAGVIFKWQFWQNGGQVALAVGSVRRNTEWYELRDIATGKLLAMSRRWDGEPPAWAAAIAEKD